MYDITEFWIVARAGIPLFYFAPEKKLDPSLIGGFFSAIQSFAQELESDPSDEDSEDYIRNISFGDINYIFRLNNDLGLYFIAKSPRKIKIEKIFSHLKSLESEFVKRYRDEILDFDGNVSKFEEFLTYIEKYFEDNFVRLKGMW